MDCYIKIDYSAAQEVHEGVVDFGPLASSTGPSHEGVVDCGRLEKSTGPFHEGVVDCGLFETPKPYTGGGGATK